MPQNLRVAERPRPDSPRQTRAAAETRTTVAIQPVTVRTLVLRSWRLKTTEDRAFTFSMLAAMAVLWIALATVYMGDQLPQVAFLLIGWGQSIESGFAGRVAVPERAAETRFVFRRVIC